jgi:hypothetical protein
MKKQKQSTDLNARALEPLKNLVKSGFHVPTNQEGIDQIKVIFRKASEESYKSVYKNTPKKKP